MELELEFTDEEYEYIQVESKKLGISENDFVVMLIEIAMVEDADDFGL